MPQERGSGSERHNHAMGSRPRRERLDARGLLCPVPVRLAARRAQGLRPGDLLEILGTDPVLPIDIEAWCHDEGHEIVESARDGSEIRILVRIGPLAV